MENNAMYKVAKFIVDKRKFFFILFAVSVILSAVAIPNVKVNNDMTEYLPSDTETRIGLDLMDKEFITYSTVKIMVSNVTYDEAEELKEVIENVDLVKSVTFSDDEEHYQKSSALFDITLNSYDDSEKELEIVDNICKALEGYDYYSYSDSIDDTSQRLNSEMSLISALAVFTVLIVLLFTSHSFMEVFVYLAVFVAAAILNMGTNIFFGQISFISNSISMVLQLALAIDYSIILSNRFEEEKQTHDVYEALVIALSKAIVEISSSSLTTVSGLAALCIMQLKIGMDLGLVLCKGILFSLLAVFLLMPGLLLKFTKLIDKTRHRSFVPSIKGWCRLVVKLRYIVPVIFICVTAVCIFLSSKCPYSFDSSSAEPTRPTEQSVARHKIEDIFGVKNALAVMVPKGDYDSERNLLNDVESLDNISSATGLSNIEFKDGYTLTQGINAREFSRLMDMDYELCSVIFKAYGLKNEEYGAFVGDEEDYKISVMDLFMFMHEEIDKGLVQLDDEDKQDIDDLYTTLTDAQKQLEGENYSRLLFTYSCPTESDEAYTLLDGVKNTTKKYYNSSVMAGNLTNCNDFKNSFSSDNRNISFLTIMCVLLILLFTFKSYLIPFLLVLTIQGSIWINFSLPYITQTPLHFLGYLVVSSIQMGATIDYAIVFTNRYLELREEYSAKDAAINSLNQSFPTILTSGSILTIAGFLIGFISSDATISSLGKALGKGTLISIILVMLVLPQIVILCDKLIAKSMFKTKESKPEDGKKYTLKGLVAMNGNVDGYVNGYIRGSFKGVINGDIDANLQTGNPNADIKLLEEEIIDYEENE